MLWRRPWLRSLLLLLPPMGWFIFIYLAALALLLVTAFWQIDAFTTRIVQVWNLDNFRTILLDPTYRLIIGRTVLMAAAVTVTDAILAFPFAYYMARVASRRTQTLLFAAVLLPLWASYIARVYSWILILNHSGLLNWSLQSIGLPPANIGYTNIAMWIVFSYIWLPFMLIPTYSAMERVPESLMEAAADLGARRWRAIRDVVLPLALPGVVAGSIFTLLAYVGRLHHADPGGRRRLNLHRQRGLQQRRHREQRAVRGGTRDGAGGDHGVISAGGQAPRRIRGSLDGRVLDALGVADVGGPDPAVPVHPHRPDPRVRVQQLEHPDLAVARPHHQVVRGDVG